MSLLLTRRVSPHRFAHTATVHILNPNGFRYSPLRAALELVKPSNYGRLRQGCCPFAPKLRPYLGNVMNVDLFRMCLGCRTRPHNRAVGLVYQTRPRVFEVAIGTSLFGLQECD